MKIIRKYPAIKAKNPVGDRIRAKEAADAVFLSQVGKNAETLTESLKSPPPPTEAPGTRKVLDENNHDPTKQISLEAICLRVVTLAQVLAEKKFYPYQIELSRRIVEALLEHSSETITALMSRQAGKSETVADIFVAIAIIIPALANKFPEDWRLNTTDEHGRYRGFAHGVKIGIYGPRKMQAEILFGRAKDAMATKTTAKVLAELKVSVAVSNGNTLMFSSGSLIYCDSASEQSKIEGKTFHIVCCVEGSALVSFADGSVHRIEDVVRNKMQGNVKCLVDGKPAVRPITGWYDNGFRESIELLTASGQRVKCTPDHRVHTVERGWVQAGDSLGLTIDSLESCSHSSEREATSKGDDRRNAARGCFDRLSLQGLKECAVDGFPRMAAAGVCLAQVGTSEGPVCKRTEAAQELEARNVHLQVRHEMPSGDYNNLSGVLSGGNESGAGEYRRYVDAESPSLLVYGRRERSTVNRAAAHRRFQQSGRGTFSEGFNVKVLSKCANISGREIRNDNDTCTKPAEVHAAGSSVCSPSTELQAEFERAGDVHLLRVQQDVSGTYERAEGQASVLFNRVSGSAEETIRRGAIQKAGLVVSIRRVGLQHVYDITVAEAHNFYANGLLVHNCEEAQDIGDEKIRKSISPMLAATRGSMIMIGTPSGQKCAFYDSIKDNQRAELISGKKNHFFFPYTVCQRYNSEYRKYIEKEKMKLGENSDEFRMAYGAEWIFERGMFVTQEQLFHPNIAMTEASPRPLNFFSQVYAHGVKHSHPYYSVVAGIDWGQSSDSTVLTLIAVDWKNPLESGMTHDIDGVHEYTFYKKHVVFWKEWLGDDYETQYWEIFEILTKYPNLVKVATDSNSCGKPIYDRLAAALSNFNVEVEAFNFSAKLKSDGYKALAQELSGHRLTFPAGTNARKTIVYRKFVNQMLDLKKQYKGGNLSVAHPDEKGAHDDFPDSLMLANWAAMKPADGNSFETMDQNIFFRR